MDDLVGVFAEDGLMFFTERANSKSLAVLKVLELMTGGQTYELVKPTLAGKLVPIFDAQPGQIRPTQQAFEFVRSGNGLAFPDWSPIGATEGVVVYDDNATWAPSLKDAFLRWSAQIQLSPHRHRSHSSPYFVRSGGL